MYEAVSSSCMFLLLRRRFRDKRHFHNGKRVCFCPGSRKTPCTISVTFYTVAARYYTCATRRWKAYQDAVVVLFSCLTFLSLQLQNSMQPLDGKIHTKHVHFCTSTYCRTHQCFQSFLVNNRKCYC